MKFHCIPLFIFICIPSIFLFSQEKTIIKLAPDTSHVLHWGQIQIPLGYYKSNTRRDTLVEYTMMIRKKVWMQDFVASLKERIFVYKDQQIFSEVDSLKISLFPLRSASSGFKKNPVSVKLDKKQLKRLDESTIQKILEGIQHRTFFNIILNNGELLGWGTIEDSFAPLEPPILVKKDSLELFNFQLLEPLAGKIILRIDTIQNKRVFNIYKKDGKTRQVYQKNKSS